MKIIAHRGNSSLEIENTKKAYLQAIKDKADIIETDIRLTKDKIPVLMHDKSCIRLCKKFKKIENINFKELKKIHKKIYTLEDFLKDFKNKATLLIELKRNEKHIEKITLNLIKKYKAEKNLIIISFDYNLLKNIRKQNKTIRLGILTMNPFFNLKKKIKEINAYSAHIFFMWYFKRNIEAKIYLWTVPKILLEHYSKKDIDGITTNHPHTLKKIISKRKL
jgi:glycerophosphoryl diester phosphodiesterase